MDDYFDVIQGAILFDGLKGEDIRAMLHCLGARRARYAKSAEVLRYGDRVAEIGMVLSGSASIVKLDFWGNRNIIARVGPGELFAESFACTFGATMDGSVIADEPCELLFFDARRVLASCPSACAFHSRAIRNLVSVLAEKNLRFHEKLTHLSQRSTRDKLLSYLSAESLRQGGAAFDIPYDRQQLADYLSVERSAMSAELGRLKKAGVLDFHKNHFALTRDA